MLKMKGVSGTHFKGGSRVFWCRGDGGKGRDLFHFRAVKNQPRADAGTTGVSGGVGLCCRQRDAGRKLQKLWALLLDAGLEEVGAGPSLGPLAWGTGQGKGTKAGISMCWEDRTQRFS